MRHTYRRQPTDKAVAVAAVFGASVEVGFGEILLDVAALLGATYLVATLLARYRIPPILGALVVGMTAAYTPLGERLASPELAPPLGLLAEIGLGFREARWRTSMNLAYGRD